MLAGILITIREGTEAFLIVAVLMGYVQKIGQSQHRAQIWIGTGGAILLSGLLAWLFNRFSVSLEGTLAQIFEMGISLVALFILSYMLQWMQEQSKAIGKHLRDQVELALADGKIFSLAMLAFVTVFREGLETALFLSALGTSNDSGSLLQGTIIGLLIAAVIGYLVYRSARLFNLALFFKLTGLIVVFIAAGLISHLIGSLQEIGIIPPVLPEVWNINWLLDENSLLGRLLHAFIGYDGNPSLMQTFGYLGYIYYFAGKLLGFGQGVSNHEAKA